MLPEGFATGSQWYLDQLPDRVERWARIAVAVVIDGREVTALLDTGASRCILSWDVAQSLPLDEEGEPETRALGGSIHVGHVFPVRLRFRAHDGQDLVVETFAWASEAFNGPNLIGYGGLLEKLRFAVDPARNLFYFG